MGPAGFEPANPAALKTQSVLDQLPCSLCEGSIIATRPRARKVRGVLWFYKSLLLTHVVIKENKSEAFITFHLPSQNG